MDTTSWTYAIGRQIYPVPGECERCPACASARLFDLDLHIPRRPIGGVRTAFISGCDDCGLVFRNPLPSPEELTEFYSATGEWGSPRSGADDAADEHAAQSKARGTARGSWTRLFEPMARASITRPPPGSAALDFGCGDGRLLDLLQDCGWETSGIETAVDTAFRRHRRLDAIPDQPAFDLVVAHHVLEHVANPLAVLRQLAAACRSGGHLVLSVPRLDTLPLHRDYKYVLNGRAHVTAYTWACMRELLARSGWMPIAPPPDRIAKGGGRTTAARLRVIAQRSNGGTPARRDDLTVLPSPAPGAAVRAAIRQYYGDRRPLLHRLGWFRLAARRAEARWRREVAAGKAAKRHSPADS